MKVDNLSTLIKVLSDGNNHHECYSVWYQCAKGRGGSKKSNGGMPLQFNEQRLSKNILSRDLTKIPLIKDPSKSLRVNMFLYGLEALRDFINNQDVTVIRLVREGHLSYTIDVKPVWSAKTASTDYVPFEISDWITRAMRYGSKDTLKITKGILSLSY